jgi:hypothetical protein
MFGGERLIAGPHANTLWVLLLMAVCGLYVMNVRCPVCRWPVIKTKTGFYGMWVPKKCRDCGNPF